MTTLEQRLLTVREVAERLAISETTTRRMIAENSIPHLRVGAQIRVDSAELSRWLVTCHEGRRAFINGTRAKRHESRRVGRQRARDGAAGREPSPRPVRGASGPPVREPRTLASPTCTKPSLTCDRPAVGRDDSGALVPFCARCHAEAIARGEQLRRYGTQTAQQREHERAEREARAARKARYLAVERRAQKLALGGVDARAAA